MRNPYVIALCVLSFAGVAYATGQIGVTGYPPVPRVLKGGTGINIGGDGTISATGEAVVTGAQPFENLSSALRGKYLGASGTAVNAGAYKGNSTPTAAEFGYMAGVKAPVQGQISSANVRIDTLNNTVITTSTIGSQTVAAATGNAGTATKLQTARNINGVAFDGTAPITVRDAGYLNYSGHDHVTTALVNAPAATPADSDSFTFFNSVLKKVSWSGIKSTLKTYFDTLYHGLTVTWSEITGKPTFATVATSGQYNDLSGRPAPYTLPKATPTTLGGVMIDNSSILIDGNGVIHSTVSAGVSSIQGYTGDPVLQLSDFPDIVAGLDSKVSQVAFNNRSTAQRTRDIAQDSAIALKANKSGDTFTGAITAPAYDTSGADNTHYTWDYNTTSCPSDAPEYAKCTLPTGVYWRKDGVWTQAGLLPYATPTVAGVAKTGPTLNVNNGVMDVVISSLGPTGLVTAGLNGNATVRKGFAYIASGNYRATFANISSGISTYASFGNYSGRLIPPAGGKFKWANPVTLANYTTSGGYSVKIPPNTSVTVQSLGDGTYHATATRNLQKTGVDEYAGPVDPYTSYFANSFACADGSSIVSACTTANAWSTLTGTQGSISGGKYVVTKSAVSTSDYLTASSLAAHNSVQLKFDITPSAVSSAGAAVTTAQLLYGGAASHWVKMLATTGAYTKWQVGYKDGAAASQGVDSSAYSFAAGHTYSARLTVKYSTTTSSGDGNLTLYISDNGGAETAVLTATGLNTYRRNPDSLTVGIVPDGSVTNTWSFDNVALGYL